MLSCTNNNESKARKLIEAYYQENANDPESVEIVKLSEIIPDSVIDYIYEYSYMSDTINLYHKTRMARLAISYDDFDKAEVYLNEADSINKEIDRKKEQFKPYLRGMIVKGKIRGKNKMGAKVLNNVIFHFDTELSKVTDVEIE